jgi:pyruvate,water dikinase
MSAGVVTLQKIDKTNLAIVGGKGANLGELLRIEDIQVPEGFCITTEVYRDIIKTNGELNSLLDQLSKLKADDRKGISETSAKIRAVIESIPVPDNVSGEITRQLAYMGERTAFAVRSSATAEDLPTASFAGQQDTYLNIIGTEEILKHVSKCWASLFTERAIVYRIQNGLDHRKVMLAIVIQKMIFPEVSGILFTADPISGHRMVISIDASFGLGEALVSGLVNTDNYKVRNGKIIEKNIPTKRLAIFQKKESGTKKQEVPEEDQNRQALSDDQILQLERIGRKIENHFGFPQDIEWCLVNNKFFIVQSRPITTLFPIPKTDDQENHVYISVGHQQMMTDALKPLGISLWQLTAGRPMHVAGGRLFVDVTPELTSPTGRNTLINVLGKSDLLVRDALTTIIERRRFYKIDFG